MEGLGGRRAWVLARLGFLLLLRALFCPGTEGRPPCVHPALAPCRTACPSGRATHPQHQVAPEPAGGSGARASDLGIGHGTGVADTRVPGGDAHGSPGVTLGAGPDANRGHTGDGETSGAKAARPPEGVAGPCPPADGPAQSEGLRPAWPSPAGARSVNGGGRGHSPAPRSTSPEPLLGDTGPGTSHHRDPRPQSQKRRLSVPSRQSVAGPWRVRRTRSVPEGRVIRPRDVGVCTPCGPDRPGPGAARCPSD